MVWAAVSKVVRQIAISCIRRTPLSWPRETLEILYLSLVWSLFGDMALNGWGVLNGLYEPCLLFESCLGVPYCLDTGGSKRILAAS